MELEFQASFWRNYRRLTDAEQQQVDAHLRILAENLLHPSLRARRWRGSRLWYARISRDLRVFFEVHDDYYLLVDVGRHDIERNY